MKTKPVYVQFFLFSLMTLCFSPAVWSSAPKKLRVGDFVLLPMNCYACRVISDESGSPYTHLGVVLSIKKSEILLAESLGKVQTVRLKDFKRRLIPGEKLAFYRLREWDKLYNNKKAYEKFEKRLISYYESDFKGLPYDNEFLWNNYNFQGEEKLYCSEFITKLINPFLKRKVLTHPMNYSKNWDFWLKYMGQAPPQGLPGNNPSFFTNKILFMTL